MSNTLAEGVWLVVVLTTIMMMMMVMVMMMMMKGRIHRMWVGRSHIPCPAATAPPTTQRGWAGVSVCLCFVRIFSDVCFQMFDFKKCR